MLLQQHFTGESASPVFLFFSSLVFPEVGDGFVYSCLFSLYLSLGVIFLQVGFFG